MSRGASTRNDALLRAALGNAPTGLFGFYSPPLTGPQRARLDAICAECGWRVRGPLPDYMGFGLVLERVS